MKEVDFLIVGQGLAGSLLAWQLHQRGKKIAVVDEDKKCTSSKIAAGMFNPINTKRFTVSATAQQDIENALSVYQSIEQALGISIIHHTPIYNVFGSFKEANDYSLKLDHPFFKQFTLDNPLPEKNTIQPFGAFEVGLSGWIDLPLLLQAMRYFLQQHHHIVTQKFMHDELQHDGEIWTYDVIKAKHIIFCEGAQAAQNPYFASLPIIPCKGDVLEFEALDLNLTRVVKKGIYIIALGGGKYKCGSTYKWENDDATPYQTDYNELKQKIAELIDVPFTITAHYSAIRPTTKTRETIWQSHPTLPNMHTINGLEPKVW
jgi:glycine/D-amino acid oxidase-like deaminating enzyme